MAVPRKVKENAALAETLIARAAEGKTPAGGPPQPATAPPDLAIVTDVPLVAPPTGAPAVGSEYAIAPSKTPVPSLTAPAVVVAPSAESWEHKYLVLRGMFDKQRAESNDKVSQLQDQITALMRMTDRPTTIQDTFHPDTPVPTASYGMTEEEIEALGGADFVESIRKIATAGAAPAIEALTSEVTDLRKGQLDNVEDNFYTQLNTLSPNWAAINKLDEFEAWLMEPEGLSGISRRNFLTNAYDDKDAVTAARYFNSFAANATSPPTLNPDVLEEIIPPNSGGGGGPPNTPQGTIYSTESITKFFKDVGLGRFKGREAEAQAIENDIFAAQSDGRIIRKRA